MMLEVHIEADLKYDELSKGFTVPFVTVANKGLPAMDHDEISVYKAPEMEQLREDILQARGNFMRLIEMLEEQKPEQREARRHALATQPDVAAVLAKPQQQG